MVPINESPYAVSGNGRFHCGFFKYAPIIIIIAGADIQKLKDYRRRMAFSRLDLLSPQEHGVKSDDYGAGRHEYGAESRRKKYSF